MGAKPLVNGAYLHHRLCTHYTYACKISACTSSAVISGFHEMLGSVTRLTTTLEKRRGEVHSVWYAKA